jgi:uncharacterized repeat protein (TIGR03806 family)
MLTRALRLALVVATPLACGDEPGFDPAAPRCLHLPRPPSRDVLQLERVLPDIAIEGGVALLQAPDDATRWYLVTQPGVVHRFGVDGGAAEVVLDISARLALAAEAGLLGMAFHPDFASNGEVFVSYTAPGGKVFASRISRFRSSDGGRTIDPATEEVLLELEQPYSNHNGGDLAFGPDGYLYFGFGDGGSSGDPQGNAQNPDTLLGKLIRIDVDGGAPYAIPADNPFAAGGGRPEIFALGLRNPWRFSFDRETGALWAGDVGQNLWEEVNLIERGENYGWNIKEGPDCFEADTCDETDMVPPVAYYRNISSASVIAGHVYRGAQLPAIAGLFIYTDFYRGTIWGVEPGSEPVVLADAGARGLVGFGEAADGELYALDYQGGIYHLRAASPPEGPGLPDLLSGTGCVAVADPQGPPAHAIAYDLNLDFWSDGASKRRWMVVPDGESITVDPDGDWQLPAGSALVKTFYRDERPLETRLFVRHDDGAWAGYTYAWDAGGTEATLLGAGETRTIDGEPWIFPDRSDCLYCHSEAAGFSLGLETAQLLRNVPGADGRPIDQLDALVELGLLRARPTAEPLPATDSDAPLADRARAYLHVNCSSCHRPDGPAGRARMDLRVGTPLADTAVCDQAPRAGDLGLIDARLVRPGDPASSVLSARMRSAGSTRMPALASTTIDGEGAALIDAWISALSGCP